MLTTHVRFLAPKDCPYTLDGTNLFEIRKVRLRPLANSLGLDNTGTHNDLLARIMARLDTLQSPKEIRELAQTQVKKAPVKKPKKKRAKKN